MKSFSYAGSLFSLRETLPSACLTLSVKSVKFICVCPAVILIERKSETLRTEEAREACSVANSGPHSPDISATPARKNGLQVTASMNPLEFCTCVETAFTSKISHMCVCVRGIQREVSSKGEVIETTEPR